MAPILEINNLYKNYGATEVLKDINVSIEKGEFLVLVGPSGCGKSTLLNCIAGLEPISGGTLRIDGHDMTHVSPKDRDIAMVFQSYALYPTMSVAKNITFGMKVRGVDPETQKSKLAEVARQLQIEPFLNRRPGQLSGGQRQRVAMGRAIVRKPAVFLFDEPLSNLDAKLRVQMRLEIKALQRDLGVTSLYVTHDQVEAMTLADRMIVMNGGVADQIGAPLEVYANPATAFVAGFIGSPPTNFLDPAQIGQSGEGKVGVRPEHMRIAPSGRLPAHVAYAEALGAETLIHLRGAQGDLLTVRQDAASPIPEEGADVSLDWDAAQEMRFDAKGQRIR